MKWPWGIWIPHGHRLVGIRCVCWGGSFFSLWGGWIFLDWCGHADAGSFEKDFGDEEGVVCGLSGFGLAGDA